MTAFGPATLASIDRDLREAQHRYERAIAVQDTVLAATYWLDLTETLLDRRLELMDSPVI